ncbi:MAG: hypothetical protein ACYDCK_13100 [Thermoplasmatota archaeon]
MVVNPARAGAFELITSLILFAMLFALFWLFLQSYRQSRAPFSLGLVVFALALGLKEFLGLATVLVRFGAKGAALPSWLSLADGLAVLAEVAAVGILLWLVAK